MQQLRACLQIKQGGKRLAVAAPALLGPRSGPTLRAPGAAPGVPLEPVKSSIGCGVSRVLSV